VDLDLGGESEVPEHGVEDFGGEFCGGHMRGL
jgi:hypothetical protein